MLLYKNTNQWLVKAGYFAAGAQIFMWINLSELALNHMKTEENGQLVRAPQWQRITMSVFCAATSVVFPWMVHYHCKRRVSQMRLIGNKIEITNSLLVSGPKTVEYSRNKVFTKESIHGSGSLYVYTNDLKYVLDRQGETD
ncbi:hypothetical protein EDD86DRAFT_237432, partial [Gorgonomyces haynaldii]